MHRLGKATWFCFTTWFIAEVYEGVPYFTSEMKALRSQELIGPWSETAQAQSQTALRERERQTSRDGERESIGTDTEEGGMPPC